MERARAKFCIAAAALVGAAGYLTASGVRAGWTYSVEVDALNAQEVSERQRTRLHGTVTPGSLNVNRAELRAAFDLSGNTSHVPVEYRGVVPETLSEDRQVFVEGVLKDGVFHADLVLTKCASKYEPGSGETPPECRQ